MKDFENFTAVGLCGAEVSEWPNLAISICEHRDAERKAPVG